MAENIIDLNEENKEEELDLQKKFKRNYNPLISQLTTPSVDSFMSPGKSIEYDRYGNPVSVDYNKAINAKPSTITSTPQLGITTQENVDYIKENIDQLGKEVIDIYSAISPEINKGHNKSALPVQVINALSTDIFQQAGKAGGATVMNILHGLASFEHTYAEEKWRAKMDLISDDDVDKKTAFSVLEALQNEGIDPLYAKTENLRDANGRPLNDRTKQIIYDYKDLLNARRDNNRRMMVEQLYESEAPRDNVFENFRIGDNKGDEGTVVGTLANITGDVAGSVAVFYVTGQLARGAQYIGARTLATLGAKTAAATLAASSVVGESAVFGTAFLNQFESIRTQALLKGWDIDRANSVAFLAGVVEGGLEFAGFKAFKRLYAREGYLRNIILGDIIPESMQEGAQTIGENIITESFGLTDKDFTDIMAEIGMAIVGGALGGGFFGEMKSTSGRMAGYLEGIMARNSAMFRGKSKEDVVAGVNAAQKAVKGTLTQEEENSLSEGAKEVKNTAMSTFGDLFKYYEMRAKNKNPKISQTQLENSFKAISNLIMSEMENGEVSQQTDRLMDLMIQHIDTTNKDVKNHIKKTNQLFKKEGLNADLARRLSSGDLREQHDAKWELAENHLTSLYEKQGVTKEAAALMVKQLKGLTYDLTAYGIMSVEDVVKRAEVQIFNMNLALFKGQATLDNFDTISLIGLFRGTSSENSNRENASKTIALLEKEQLTDAEMNELSLMLFHRAAESDDLNASKRQIRYLAQLEENVFNNLPFSSKTDLSAKDFEAMALMRLSGASQEQINDAFGLTNNSDMSAQEAFDSVSDAIYPKLDDYTLSHIRRYVSKGYAKNTTAGWHFGKERRILITPFGVDNATIIHEFQHSLTKDFFMDLYELKTKGLLDEDSLNPLISIFNDLYDIISKSPEYQTVFHLNENDAAIAFNETLSNLMDLFISNGGKTGNIEIDSLINKALFNVNYFVSQDSLIDKNLDTKSLLKKESDIISGRTSELNNVSDAQELEDFATFQKGFEEGKDWSEELYNKLVDYIEKHDVNLDGIDDLRAELLIARQMNPIFLASLAVEISNNAKTQSLLNIAKAVKEEEKKNALVKKYLAGQKNQAKPTEEVVSVTNTISGEEVQPEQKPVKKPNKGVKSSYESVYRREAAQKPKEKDMNEHLKGKGARQESSIKQQLKEEFTFKGAATAINRTFSSLTQSIDDAAMKVSPELARIINTTIYRYNSRMLDIKDKIAVITEAIDKNFKEHEANGTALFTKEEYAKEFWLPLVNREEGGYEKAGAIIKERLGEEAFNTYNELVAELKTIRLELIEKGLGKNLFDMENDVYFPSEVKNYEGLITEYFGNKQTKNDLSKLINRMTREFIRRNGGKALTAKQIKELNAAIINEINSRYQKDSSDERDLTFLLKRQITDKTAGMFEYYHDPFDTLTKFFDSAYRTMMMRDLVGKITYDENGNPIFNKQGLVGNFLIQFSYKLGGIEGQTALENFENALKSLARRQDNNKLFWKTVREINQLTVLGSVFNAINQLSDLAPAFAIFGISNTFQAISDVMKGIGITVRDVAAQSSNESLRIQGEGVLKKLTKKVFKKTGFEWADVKVKDVILNAAKHYFQSALNNPNSQEYKEAMRYFNQCFPESKHLVNAEQGLTLEKTIQRRNNLRTETLEALKKGDMENPNVKYLMFFMLNKLQPLNAASVPAGYNKNGELGKLCYQFATVALRQLETLRDFYKGKLETGGKAEAIKGIVKLALFAALIGVPKEVIENLLRGRKTDLAKTAALSPLHYFMINEYIIDVAKREGIASAAFKMMGPSFGLADNVTKDTVRLLQMKDYRGNTWKSVPIFGPFMYMWFFGGANQTRETGLGLLDSDNISNTLEDAIEEMRDL